MAPSVSNKRARAPATSSAAKKAKVVDPVMAKVDLVASTISDPECQMQDSLREMFLLAIPHSLPVPSEERHEYQTKVLQMMGDVLSEYVGHWEQQVATSKADIAPNAQKAEETMKTVEESASKIGSQEDEVSKCKGIVSEKVEALKAAEDALQSASKEVAEFDANLQVTIGQKDHVSSIYNDYFIPLKTGGIDAKEVTRLLKEVQPMLKKLNTESSLLSAIAPAFKKSPSDRGAFDTMVIEGAEAVFTKHLGELQEQIDQADTTKAEKVSKESASRQELEAATEQKATSENALKTAETDLAALEAKHTDLLMTCNAAAEIASASEAVVATKEGRLTEVKQAFSTFTELLERQANTSESVVDSTMEAKLEAVGETCQMELSTVA
eukprot:gnl/MRDRNA2_/MRDRNA2_89593_c0_seq1.p1 gnl/MRDRNA2_/MRDRNA2_89593_c0~~gnl/MRDRNA2_/MRDRNA2_89593_c0_seq1.p1  ORF type:complete len:416 (+),score=127.30 gnl/MRDRNA2_/MRDRNA2_89593_c0_seq1:100-1248(+)